MIDVSLPAAAFAGLLSFLSPCVLPLVPPYLCFLAGTTAEELEARGPAARREVLLAAALFVAGFATVFVALGASASALGQVVRRHLDLLTPLAGLAIIGMGLHFLGAFRIGLLYREARVQVARPVGPWGAYVMGLAFAFGWTPCLGPVLGAILAVAGAESTVGRGAGLLAAYSAGLGLPFLAAAAALGPFSGALGRFRAHFGMVEKATGALLVLTGLAFLTGTFTQASYWLLETFPALGRLG